MAARPSTDTSHIDRDARIDAQLRKYNARTPAERDCIKALVLYEELQSKQKGRAVYANRTWPLLRRLGIRLAVETLVDQRNDPSGYAALVKQGLEDLSFEAAILRYPDEFSANAVAMARARLANYRRAVPASHAISRRKFIKSHGATCVNWAWSWSFVNAAEKLVIFGVWDIYENNLSLILSEEWAIRRGRRQSAYPQSREHIRLIEEEGYRLVTFPMIYGSATGKAGAGPAKIRGFRPVLTPMRLVRVKGAWYATNDEGSTMPHIAEEERQPGVELWEGAVHLVTVNAYERNPEARARCLAHHGYACVVCAFDFEKSYGEIGKGYIHVHHIKPLAEIRATYIVDPINDLVPVCPNCHSMIHRAAPALTLDQLVEARSRLKPPVKSGRVAANTVTANPQAG